MTVSRSSISGKFPACAGLLPLYLIFPAGETWPLEQIFSVKKDIEDHHMSFHTIESVNIHEDIKLGLPSRDLYIENYRQTLRHLAKAGGKGCLLQLHAGI